MAGDESRIKAAQLLHAEGGADPARDDLVSPQLRRRGEHDNDAP